MRVVYSDETDNCSDDEPLVVVAACMVNVDTQWTAVDSALHAIVRAAPPKLLPRNDELKGADLLRRMRRNTPDAERVLRDVLTIPAKHGIPIFYGAVNRAGLKRAQTKPRDPHLSMAAETTSANAVALAACIQSVDEHLHRTAPGEKVVWIADRSGHERPMKSQAALFRYYRAIDVLPPTSIHPSPIVDTIYFGHSEESRGVQLADVCCSAISANLQGLAYARPFYELLRPAVVNDGADVMFAAWK
jgi:hypothetical protein